MTSNPDTTARERRSLSLNGQIEPRDLPTTPRGLRTRAKLIEAARAVFERDGFLDARVVDITNEAGISAGSFYTYFDSKEEVFSAVMAEVEEEMLHPAIHEVTRVDDPVAVIRASNRAYIDLYQKNANFMRLLNQVSSIDEGFREVRRLRGESFIKRNAKNIAELQKRGLVDTSIDSALAAAFLSGMVARAAYSRFVLGDQWEIDDMVETLTTLWANALKLDGTVR